MLDNQSALLYAALAHKGRRKSLSLYYAFCIAPKS